MITAQRIAKAAGKYPTRLLLRLRAALGAKARFSCPACNNEVVGFFRYGDNARWGCPICGASPRERLVHHCLDRGTLSLPTENGTILHIAPGEHSLVRRFQSAAQEYIPADLDPSRYTVAQMRKVDLMNMAALRNSVDLFYASHVMEHVPDDAAVLANIHACLRPGGEAWLVVPLWDRPTEDGSLNLGGRERERRFGQWDHLRQYGLDFADRIRAAGFTVDLIHAANMAAADRNLMALDDVIFRARKPSAAEA